MKAVLAVLGAVLAFNCTLATGFKFTDEDSVLTWPDFSIPIEGAEDVTLDSVAADDKNSWQEDLSPLEKMENRCMEKYVQIITHVFSDLHLNDAIKNWLLDIGNYLAAKAIFVRLVVNSDFSESLKLLAERVMGFVEVDDDIASPVDRPVDLVLAEQLLAAVKCTLKIVPVEKFRLYLDGTKPFEPPRTWLRYVKTDQGNLKKLNGYFSEVEGAYIVNRLFNYDGVHRSNNFREAVELLLAGYIWESVSDPDNVLMEPNTNDEFDYVLDRVLVSTVESGHVQIGVRILHHRLARDFRLPDEALVEKKRVISLYREAYVPKVCFTTIISNAKLQLGAIIADLNKSYETLKKAKKAGSQNGVQYIKSAERIIQGLVSTPEKQLKNMQATIKFAHEHPDIDTDGIKTALNMFLTGEQQDLENSEHLQLLRIVTDRPDLDVERVKNAMSMIDQDKLTPTALKDVLLKLRADLDRPGGDGLTPLVREARNLCTEMTSILLEYGASPYAIERELSGAYELKVAPASGIAAEGEGTTALASTW